MKTLTKKCLIGFLNLILFVDEKLGILSFQGWMTGMLVLCSIALAIAVAFLFVNFWVSLAWLLC